MNVSNKAVCFLCNSHGPDKLRRDCFCVGERDGVVHYPCLVDMRGPLVRRGMELTSVNILPRGRSVVCVMVVTAVDLL